MSFYRRYSGVQPPVVPGDRMTAPIPPAIKPGAVLPANPAIFPTTPKEVLSFSPTQPIRSYAPGLFPPRTASSFLPPGSTQADPVSTNPTIPGGAKTLFDHPIIRKAAASDQKATETAQTARNAVRDANAAIFDANKAATKAQMDPNADVDAKLAAQVALRAQQRANAAAGAADAANEKAKADAAAAQVVIDKGLSTPKNDGGSVPYDTSGGGYDNFGPVGPASDTPPVPDLNNPVVDPQAGQKNFNLLAVGAAAGGGFLAGGPVGALVGAAVGYFLSKPASNRGSAQMAWYRR